MAGVADDSHRAQRGRDDVDAAALTLGVFAGTAAWWIGLVIVVGLVRTRLSRSGLRRINVVSGLLIGAFALVALGSAFVGPAVPA